MVPDRVDCRCYELRAELRIAEDDCVDQLRLVDHPCNLRPEDL